MARDKTDKTDETPVATLATTATWVAGEWGIPDWRDPSAYGDVKRWTFMRWHWEFLRRRQDVREFFDTWAQVTYTENMEYHVLLKGSPGRPVRFLEPWLAPHEPGYSVLCLPDEQRRFGMTYVPNPRIAQQRDYYFIYDPLSYDQKGDMVHPDGLAREITLEPGEAAIVFRLDLPLAPQLETAGRSLSSEQALLHGKPLQKRRHPTKWLGYLRTLDARDDGASWAEIAALHPNTAQTAQTARDRWEASNALRFNF